MSDNVYFIKIKVNDKKGETVSDMFWIEHALGIEELTIDEETFYTAYYSDENALNTIINSIMALPAISIVDQGEVEQKDWVQDWMKEMKPRRIGKDITINYSILKKKYKGRLTITIIPAKAFGTGFHESTILCLKELGNLSLKKKHILDLGCGTGILGIYAALKGAKRITAIDNDPDATEETIRNAGLNRCIGKMNIITGTIRKVKDRRFDIIISNILKEPLIKDMKAIMKCLKKKGIWIFSGITRKEQKDMERAIAKLYGKNIRWHRLLDWACGIVEN